MPAPALLAVDADSAALGEVERELRGRYEGSYRVICTGSPDEALAILTRLSDAGEEVALVLAGQWLSETTGGELLEHVRQLHPHAKRGLLVAWGEWGHRPTAEAIFDSMALGRIDYYVLRPAVSPDELFHQAISSFLLEWTQARRIAPHTIRVVGEAWAGRAHELRDALQRCAIPHAFYLSGSREGRVVLAKAGPGAKLPLMILPDGQVLSDPTDREIADATGSSIDPEAGRLRRGHRRCRTGRPFGSRLWRVRRPGHPGGGRGRDRWTGHLEFADPQLPGLPARRQRETARSAGLPAGLGLRGELRLHA